MITSNIMDCPCIDCVCMAICRHKRYILLFESCELLMKYEPHYIAPGVRRAKRIIIIETTIDPTTWKYDLNVCKTGMVVSQR